MKTYTAIGIMSGTSCDGLDMVLCRFSRKGTKYEYSILKALTFQYSEEWLEKIARPPADAQGLIMLHKEYGRFIGNCVVQFIKGYNEKIDFIASHGHTVFHNPASGYTFQIGDGSSIAAVTGITVISDFRAADAALGGQGAPLVPAGDRLLFGDYDFCLNMGGISNISYKKGRSTIAFDICPCNVIINLLCNEIGLKYDNMGMIGAKGAVDMKLLLQLNSISYYNQKPPKSLDKKQILDIVMPIVNSFDIKTEDKLRTLYEHISIQVAQVLTVKRKGTLLVSGGGALNTFLIDLIQSKTPIKIILPEKGIIEFKEALIFAFLGLLRLNNKNNCLSSVTGASRDSCGGVISKI